MLKQHRAILIFALFGHNMPLSERLWKLGMQPTIYSVRLPSCPFRDGRRAPAAAAGRVHRLRINTRPQKCFFEKWISTSIHAVENGVWEASTSQSGFSGRDARGPRGPTPMMAQVGPALRGRPKRRLPGVVDYLMKFGGRETRKSREVSP